VLVTLLLVLAVVVGTVGASAFLTVRVVQEGRSAVVAARGAFPAAWSSVAAATPFLADAADGGEEDEGSGGATRGLKELTQGVGLPPWVAAYQQDALSLVQRSLPGVAAWLEGQLHGLMRAHNLTDALGDVLLLLLPGWVVVVVVVVV
jgi:hypothetical protein